MVVSRENVVFCKALYSYFKALFLHSPRASQLWLEAKARQKVLEAAKLSFWWFFFLINYKLLLNKENKNMTLHTDSLGIQQRVVLSKAEMF